MTIDQLYAFFDAHGDEYLNFNDFTGDKPSNRRDLCAMIILDRLLTLPANRSGNMVVHAEHDEFWLDIELVALAKVATEELLLNLIRCGVGISEDALSFIR